MNLNPCHSTYCGKVAASTSQFWLQCRRGKQIKVEIEEKQKDAEIPSKQIVGKQRLQFHSTEYTM